MIVVNLIVIIMCIKSNEIFFVLFLFPREKKTGIYCNANGCPSISNFMSSLAEMFPIMRHVQSTGFDLPQVKVSVILYEFQNFEPTLYL
jgi:hypothetical protein